MKLLKSMATIEGSPDGAEMLRCVERAGRTCYKSEGKISYDSAKRFVAKIVSLGHESVLEHEKVTVRFVCDRGVSHEIVRHRIASYSQESIRYCNYSGGVAFIIPPWVDDIKSGDYPCHSMEGLYPIIDSNSESSLKWYEAMWRAETIYLDLLKLGWKPQEARSVLPNSLKTEIVVTMNLRGWRNFFKLRTSKAAHPQMLELTIPLLARLRELVPIVFDDIRPLISIE